jgi:hypothetical protein
MWHQRLVRSIHDNHSVDWSNPAEEGNFLFAGAKKLDYALTFVMPGDIFRMGI